MRFRASHLGGLVIRPEAEMQPAFGLPALIEADEVQPRQAIRFGADLELLVGRMDHNPAPEPWPATAPEAAGFPKAAGSAGSAE